MLFAAVLAPASPPDGTCLLALPPGKENFEKRTVTLPGGAELTLAWIEASRFQLVGDEVQVDWWREHDSDRIRQFDPIPKEAVWMDMDGFWIGVCEVTQKQWTSVMGSNPSYFRGEELAVASQRAELPVESVSWEECMEFCRRTGLRLPTEMEWLLVQGAIWTYAGTPWSWTAKNSGNRTHPVGRSYAGVLGVFDMDGNVCEWCADWFGKWPGTSATNYAGPATGTERVICGGCWCGSDWFDGYARENRLSMAPDGRYNHVGFRVCLTPARGE